MAMLRALGLLMATAVMAALWVVNCSGPRPAVADVRVAAPAGEGEPYRVAAVVRNEGWGHGQVRVTFRLRDRASGQAFQEEAEAQLEAGEVALVVAEIDAPPGDYEPAVEAEYPPR
jgi:hypothetical protein